MTSSNFGMAGSNAGQLGLLPQRVSTINNGTPQGADIAYSCITREGSLFYCKRDKPSRPIRSIEMFATRLANHVNISVPYCTIIEEEGGDTLFGSQASGSPANGFAAQAFLTSVQCNEIGAPDTWLGKALSALYAYDQFLGNPDRSKQNFLLEDGTRRLCAYDFADVRLATLGGRRFLPENSNTVQFGRFLRSKHGPETASALEMVDRLDAVPVEVIRSIWVKCRMTGCLPIKGSGFVTLGRISVSRACLLFGQV